MKTGFPDNGKTAEIFPVHSYIVDEMEARDWNTRDLALHSGIDQHTVELLVSGFLRVDLSIADGLAQAFGTSTDVWARLDSIHRSVI